MSVLDSFKSIDITDKTVLQEQFNYCRKQYFDAISTMDEISKNISTLKRELIEISTEYYEDVNLSASQINAKLKADVDYQEKLFEISCYEKSLDILEEKINFIKSDIRILSNSMYNKF